MGGGHLESGIVRKRKRTHGENVSVMSGELIYSNSEGDHLRFRSTLKIFLHFIRPSRAKFVVLWKKPNCDKSATHEKTDIRNSETV